MTYRRTIRRRFNKRNVGGSNKKLSKQAKKSKKLKQSKKYKKNTKRRKQRCKSKEELSVEMVFLPSRKKNRT